MSVAHPVLPQHPFAETLRPFRRRSILLAATRFAIVVTLGVLISLLAAMWFDLVWALSESVRWWVSRGSLLVGLLAVMAGIALVVQRRGDDELANRIDSAKRTGGEILVGWQLASRPIHPVGSLTAGLAELATERARSLVASFSPVEVFPADSVRKTAMYFGGLILGTGLLAAMMPSIAKNQLARFLTPSADVPPYTGILIELDLPSDAVRYGQDLLVAANVSSDSIERLQLVSRTSDGIENVLPMLPIRSTEATQAGTRWQTLLTRVTQPLTIHARSGNSRSRHHELRVRMTPQILPPVIRVTPPEYARRSVYEGPIPQSGLSGLAGTTIDWQVTSNRPLAEGRLSLSYRDGSREQVRLSPNPKNDGGDVEPIAVVGSMQLSKAGRFDLSVIDVEGIESQESVHGNITILTDGRPVVRITSPRQFSLATPDIELPIVIAAEDDFGVASVSLFRSLNGSSARKIDFKVDVSPRQEIKETLPLNRYSLESGDEIQLFARVEDNDPAGPKGAESPVTTIRIISVAEFQEMMIQRKGTESLQAKYEAAQRYFENIAEALREVQQAAAEAAANPDSAAAQEQLQEKLQAAQQAASEAAKALQKLSEQAMPIDVDQELAKRLAEMSEQAGEMANELGQMSSAREDEQQPLSESEQQKLDEMSKQVGENREQLQDQAIDPMQQMQKMLPLVVDQQRFTQIATQQRDLEQRLNSLKAGDQANDPETERRIAELEHQQQQLRQSLDELLDDIEAHANDLPDEPELEQLKQTALDFATAVRESDAGAKMQSAQQNLMQGEFAGARSDAKSAADTLESFLGQCDSMGGEACENCKAAFKPGSGGPKLGNSIQQLLAMMGMKPGTSGSKPGGQPGMGFGFGAGGGFAQRSPGPQNVGMYGSLPTSMQSKSQGRGEQSSGGIAAESRGAPGNAGNIGVDIRTSGNAAGQADQAVPSQYRSQVAEYFRKLAEQTGAE